MFRTFMIDLRLPSRAIAFDYLFRHPERSRPKGGVAEGPLLVDEATEQVPPLRLATRPAPVGMTEVFCHMRQPWPSIGSDSPDATNAGQTHQFLASRQCEAFRFASSGNSTDSFHCPHDASRPIVGSSHDPTH